MKDATPFNFNDPARLLDCPYCEGTYFPEDEKCSFCGNKVYHDENEEMTIWDYNQNE